MDILNRRCGVVICWFLSQYSASLLWDHVAMFYKLFSKNRAARVIPINTFTCRAKRILIKTGAVFACAFRVTFCQVGRYRAECLIQLVSYRLRSSILHQFRHIIPRQRYQKQRVLVSTHLPERVFLEYLRSRLFPLSESPCCFASHHHLQHSLRVLRFALCALRFALTATILQPTRSPIPTRRRISPSPSSVPTESRREYPRPWSCHDLRKNFRAAC